ncbi:MAG: OmpA family protein [Vicinamibacteria bacterium]
MTNRKSTHLTAAVIGLSLSLTAAEAAPQRVREALPVRETPRAILAITYPLDDTISVVLEGTGRLPDANGEAKVERKTGATEIEIELDEMKPADLFGGDYNTYVLWAASPEGQADNLGELILTGNRSKLNVTTPLDGFGLFVTAEPHFHVGSPSPFVVLENVRAKDEDARYRSSTIPYSGFEGDYRFERVSLQEMKETAAVGHPHLEEARTAVDLAKRAGAARYASPELERARKALLRAEVRSESEGEAEDLLTRAHEAVRLAVSAERTAQQTAAKVDVARTLQEKDSALASRAREIEAKEDRIRELESLAATAETDAERARLTAEEERLRAELQAERAAEAEFEALRADRMLRENESALARREREIQEMEQQIRELEAQASQAKTDAERSRLLVEQQQLRAQLEAERAADAEARARHEMSERLEAEEEAQELRVEREEARRELQAALEEILEVRETARGLIVNIPNVLFDLDRATLKPEGREKLSQVAGILGLARGYRLSVEGHADNTGEGDYNMDLSRRRAESVRDYVVSQGIPAGIVATEAFGEDEPLASNQTAEGRQQNRRVEIVVEELPDFAILVFEPTDNNK